MAQLVVTSVPILACKAFAALHTVFSFVLNRNENLLFNFRVSIRSWGRWNAYTCMIRAALLGGFMPARRAPNTHDLSSKFVDLDFKSPTLMEIVEW